MCAAIKHRGPDDSGAFLDQNVALGNVRLSIIDVAHGHQPMYSEQRSVVVTYNGEIYNYKDLKKELESLGHKFISDSDTEVIVHCYEEFGEFFVERLRGMFAFAIWDAEKKRLIIGRDRLGIKPLYYYLGKDFLVFGSEIKAILQFEQVERRVNIEALHHFLTLSYVPGPATMFDGIRKLLPGHVLSWQLNGKENSARVSKYWEPSFGHWEQEPNSNVVEQVRALFAEAVKTHLMSEVPLGVYLSGGLDSSAIVGVMSKFVEEPIKTFTIGFGEPTDEFKYARMVAERFHTDHNEFMIETDFSKDFPRVVWHLDEPIADPAVFPTYAISSLAKKYVTVSLVGEGGDEVFAGYDKYKLFIMAKRLTVSNSTVTRVVSRLFDWLSKPMPKSRTKYYLETIAEYFPKSRTELYTRLITDGFTEQEKRELYSERIEENTRDLKISSVVRPYFENDLDDLNKMILFDQKVWMPDRLLMKVDKMTMACSVEARVPFLDHRLMEFCNELPPNLRMGKSIFKKAMAGVLPKAILQRKKQPFSNIPLRKWLEGEFGEVGMQLLDSLQNREFFRRDRVLRLFADVNKVKHDNQIWDLMMLEMWYKLFIENENVVNPNLSLEKFV